MIVGPLTLIKRKARNMAMPVTNTLQPNRKMRDNFCTFFRGALIKTGIGIETRYKSVKMLHERKTPMRMGEMAG